LWAGSQALWTLFTDVLHVELPYPSPVELGYLAFPVAAAFGLRWLGSSTPLQSRSRRVLDGLMVGCALCLVAWMARLSVVVKASAAAVLADVVLLYYPLSDVVLVTIVVLTIGQLRYELRRWVLLGSGVLLMAVADHVFAYELAHGSFRGGSSFAWGWWLGFGLIGAGALLTGVDWPPSDPVRSARAAL
jgi:diguanylate cyclase